AVLLFARRARIRSAALAASGAVLSGGLFYTVNAVRLGNPIPPYLAPPLPTFLSPLSQARALHAFRWGMGRGPLAFLLAPLRTVTDTDAFGTPAGLFNPLAWIGLLALASGALRRRHAPLVLVAGVSYASWFWTNQVSRLLFPAALLLAVPTGEI